MELLSDGLRVARMQDLERHIRLERQRRLAATARAARRAERQASLRIRMTRLVTG